MEDVWWREGLRAQPFFRVVESFCSGRSTPRAYLEELLENVDKHECRVKAFTVLDAAYARRQADESTARYRSGNVRSSLDGCPVGIKDIIDTRDFLTAYGSELYQDYTPRFDAACVQALKEGGAVLLGKTVTTEFAMGKSGPTVNPYRDGHTPGGSSSGSAAAPAAGMVPVALGSQTQGSVVRPASFCGVVGFKPTHGMLPTGGVHSVSSTHDHLGVLGVSVEDCWSVAALLAKGSGVAAVQNGTQSQVGFGLPEPTPPRRLARLYFDAWDQEVPDAEKIAMERYVRHLRQQGIQVSDRHNDEQLNVVEQLLSTYSDDSMRIVAYEMCWPFRQYRERYASVLSPRILELLDDGAELDVATYRQLLWRREEARLAVRALGAQFDGFITLAASSVAPHGLAYTGSRKYPAVWTWLGFPAFSLPLLAVAGLPLGVQLMHVDGADAFLCGTARWMMRDREQSLGRVD